MKIESFEPYHIGTRLQPHVNLEILGNKMRKLMKQKEYEISEKSVSEMSIPIVPPREILGVKNGVRVEFNLPAQALNIIGEEPEKVIQIFKEVSQMLSDLNYDLKETVAFHEIVATIIIKSTKHPRYMINKCSKIDLTPLKDLGEVVVDSIRIVNIDPTEEQGAIRLIVEPSSTSPDTRYSVRLLYRTLNKKKIESFHAELQNRVLKVIGSLE